MADPPVVTELEPGGSEAPSSARDVHGQGGVAKSGKGSSFRSRLFCGLVAPSASSFSLGSNENELAEHAANQGELRSKVASGRAAARESSRKLPPADSTTTSTGREEQEEEEKQSDCCLSLSSFRQQAAAAVASRPSSTCLRPVRSKRNGATGDANSADEADQQRPEHQQTREGRGRVEAVQLERLDSAPAEQLGPSCNNLVRMIVDKNTPAGDSCELASVVSGLDEPPVEPLILLGGARCPAVADGSASGRVTCGACSSELLDSACEDQPRQQPPPPPRTKASTEGGNAAWLVPHKSSGGKTAGGSTPQRALDQLVELLNQFARRQQQAKQQQQQQSSVMASLPIGQTCHQFAQQSVASQCQDAAHQRVAAGGYKLPTQLDPLYLEPSWSAFVQLDSSGTSPTGEQQAGNNDVAAGQRGEPTATEQARQRRSNLRLQQDAIWELLTTEAFYLSRLRVIIDLFLASLASLQRQSLLLEVEANGIFSNVTEVYRANWQLWTAHLEPMLLDARSTGQPLEPSTMRNAFVQIRSLFSPYYRYCLEHTACLGYVRELSRTNELFKVYVAWCESQKDCERLKLMDLLARPMQRLTRYSLLLKAIAKRTDDLEQFSLLEQMTAHMDKFVLTVDLELRRKEELERLLAVANRIDAFESGQADLNSDEADRFARNFAHFELRAPIFNCPFECHRQLLYDSSSSAGLSLGPIKFRDALASAKLDVVLLLLTDQLLVCKQTSSAGSGSNSRWPYHHQQHHHTSGSSPTTRAACAGGGHSPTRSQPAAACNYPMAPNYASAAGGQLSARLSRQKAQAASSQLTLTLASCNSSQELASRPSAGQLQHLAVGAGRGGQKRGSVGSSTASNQHAAGDQLLAAGSSNLPLSPHSSCSSLAGHVAREFFVRGSSDNHHQQRPHQPAQPAVAPSKGSSPNETRLRAIRSPYPVERLVMHELKDGQGVVCCQLNDSLTVASCFILYTCGAATTPSGAGSGEQLVIQATNAAANHHQANNSQQQQRTNNFLRAQDSSRSESESLQSGLGLLGGVGGGSGCSSRRSSDCRRRAQQPVFSTPAKQLIALIKEAQVRYQLAASLHNVHLTTLSGNLVADCQEPTREQQHSRSRWSSFRHQTRASSEKGASSRSSAAPTAPSTPVKQRSTENSRPGANIAASNGPACSLASPQKPWSGSRRSASSENQALASSAEEQQQPLQSPSRHATSAANTGALMKAITEQHQSMLLNHGLHDELATHDYLYQVLDESYLRVVPVAVGLQAAHSCLMLQRPSPVEAEQQELWAPTADCLSPDTHRLAAEPTPVLPSVAPSGPFRSDSLQLEQQQQLKLKPSSITSAISSSSSSSAESVATPSARPTSGRGRQIGLSPHWHSPSTRRRGWHLAEAHKVSISASNIHELVQPTATQTSQSGASKNQQQPTTTHLQLEKGSQRRNLSSLRRQNVILSASSEQAQQLQLQLLPTSTAAAAESGARANSSLLAAHSASTSNSLESTRRRGQPPQWSRAGAGAAQPQVSRLGVYRCDSSVADTTMSTTTGPSVSSSAPISSGAPESGQQQQFLSRQRQDGSSQATTMDQTSITLDDSNFDLLLLAESQVQVLQLQQHAGGGGCFATPLSAANCADGAGARATSFELGDLRPHRSRSLIAEEPFVGGCGQRGNSTAREESAHAPRSVSMETRSPISVTLTLPNSDAEDNRERAGARQRPPSQSPEETHADCSAGERLSASSGPQHRQPTRANWSADFPQSFLNIPLRRQRHCDNDSAGAAADSSSSHSGGRRASLLPIDSHVDSARYELELNCQQLQDIELPLESSNSESRASSASSQRQHQHCFVAAPASCSPSPSGQSSGCQNRRTERQTGADRLPVFNVTAASPLNLDGPACDHGDNGDICNESFVDDSRPLSAACGEHAPGQSMSAPASKEARRSTAHLRAHWALQGSSGGKTSVATNMAATSNVCPAIRYARSAAELDQLEPDCSEGAVCGESSGATLLGKCRTFFQSKRHYKGHKRLTTATTTTTSGLQQQLQQQQQQQQQQRQLLMKADEPCELGSSWSAENIVRASSAGRASAAPASHFVSSDSSRREPGPRQVGEQCRRVASQQTLRRQQGRRGVHGLSVGAEVDGAVALGDYNDLCEGQYAEFEDDDDDLLEFGAALIDVNCINSLMRERQAACSPCEPGSADNDDIDGKGAVSGYLGFHEKLDLHNRRLAEAATRGKRKGGSPAAVSEPQGGGSRTCTGSQQGRNSAAGGNSPEQQQVLAASAARSAFGWLAGTSSSSNKQAFLAKSPRHSSSTNSSSGSRSSRALNLTRSMTGEIFDSFLRATSLRSVSSGKANL